MKNAIKYLFCFVLLWSCSDDSEGETTMQAPSFTFQISGAINKTISGNIIVFNETTVDVDDFEGNATQLTTLLVDARDASSDDTVTFAVTLEGTGVGNGSYDIGTDIFEFYNAFLNFSLDNGTTIAYQSQSGSISLSSKSSSFASGSINVNCLGGDGSITISGTFTAESIN